MINGENVVIGDRVYDIISGPATVVAVEKDGAMVVKYTNGMQTRFSAGGFFGDRRRLYWHNPFIIDPRKDDADAWGSVVNIVRGVYDLVGGRRG